MVLFAWKTGLAKSTIAELKSRANPIDIVNGPDSSAGVVAACLVIWSVAMLP